MGITRFQITSLYFLSTMQATVADLLNIPFLLVSLPSPNCKTLGLLSARLAEPEGIIPEFSQTFQKESNDLCPTSRSLLSNPSCTRSFTMTSVPSSRIFILHQKFFSNAPSNNARAPHLSNKTWAIDSMNNHQCFKGPLTPDE